MNRTAEKVLHWPIWNAGQRRGEDLGGETSGVEEWLEEWDGFRPSFDPAGAGEFQGLPWAGLERWKRRRIRAGRPYNPALLTVPELEASVSGVSSPAWGGRGQERRWGRPALKRTIHGQKRQMLGRGS